MALILAETDGLHSGIEAAPMIRTYKDIEGMLQQLHGRLTTLLSQQSELQRTFTPKPLGRPRGSGNKQTITYNPRSIDADDVSWMENQLDMTLLTIEQERTLLRNHTEARTAYRKGLKLDPHEKEEKTQRLYCELQEATTPLVQSNIRLAKFHAKKYRGRGVPYGDLVLAGITGLLEALNRYDLQEHSKTRFTTYATWWIRQYLQTAQGTENTNAVTSVPMHVLHEVATALQGLESEKSVDEVAKDMETNAQRLQRALSIGQKISLSNKLDGGHEFSEILQDHATRMEDGPQANLLNPNVSEFDRTITNVLQRDREVAVRQAMELYLSPRQKKILELRFFGDPGNPGKKGLLPLRRIGQLIGVSKDRVRQIITKAIRKLRKEAAVLLAPYADMWIDTDELEETETKVADEELEEAKTEEE